MKPKNEIKEVLGKLNIESKENIEHPAYLPLQNQNKTMPTFEQIKKKILIRFSKNEYEQLQQELQHYDLTKKDIEDLFRAKGNAILGWAVIFGQNSEALKFLVRNVPNAILKELFSENDYEMLKTFCLKEKGLEVRGFYNENSKNTQIEKFKLFLEIDAKGVLKIIETSPITENIKQNFLIANQSKKPEIKL
jgi:hypothetical protein